MHELGVTQNLLDLAVQHAEQASAKRITDLYLVIGELSSIVDDSIQFYWDFVTKDTIAAGSTLHFERVGATLRCQDCGHEFPLNEDYQCPACQSRNVSISGGDQFFLKSIEVEE